jgi:hypothetical protein
MMDDDEGEDVFDSADEGSSSGAGSVDELLGVITNARDEASQEAAARSAIAGADRTLRSAGSGPARSARRAGDGAPRPLVRRVIGIGDAEEQVRQPLAVVAAAPADPMSLHNPGAARPFKCPCCTQWFSSKGLLGKHLRERTDRCIPCGEAADRLEAQLGFEKCPKCSFYFAGLGSHSRHCKATPVVGDDPNSGEDHRARVNGACNDIPQESLKFISDLPVDQMGYFGTTIRLVPRKLQGPWRLCQEVVVKLFEDDEAEIAWKLHLVSCAMIWAPLPSRESSRASVNKVLLKRMSRFMRGDFEALLTEAHLLAEKDIEPYQLEDECEELLEGMTANGNAPLSKASLARARTQVQECAYGKAAQTLLSKQLLSASDPLVRSKVEEQYKVVKEPAPLAPRPLDLETNEKYEWEVGTITVAVIQDKATDSDGSQSTEVDALLWVCGHLPRFKAQDIVGFRYEHYKDLSDKLIRHLTFCYMNAQVPRDVICVVASARGFIIDKGEGDPRCVHSVLTLRKIASRTAVIQDREWIGLDLAEVGQYGVAIKGGVEFVYQVNRCAVLAALDEMDVSEKDTLYASGAQPVALQTDFKNAFPSLEQAKILEGIEDHADPRMWRFARSARLLYDGERDPVVVFVENGAVVLQQVVRNGAHQGDPFGCLHFALGIRPLCAKIQSKLRGTNAVCAWIIDDCSFAGELESGVLGYEVLQEESPGYGLELKLRKLKAWLPLMANHLVGLEKGVDFPELSAEVSDVERNAFELVRTLVDHGFEVRKDGIRRVLGAPLTHEPALVGEWVKASVCEAAQLMERIVKLEDPCHEFGVARYCAATKLLHLPRYLAPDTLTEVLVENDQSMRRVADHISGRSLTDLQWLRVKLPTRFGGNGWSDPLLTAPAAHVSAAVLSAGLMHKAATREGVATSGSGFEPFEKKMMVALASTKSLVEAVSAVNIMAASSGAVDESLCPSLVDIAAFTLWPSQRDMSSVFHKDRLKKVMAEVQAVDRSAAAYLRSCTQFGSGQWLHAVPMLHYFAATPAEWQMMWNTRLGVEVPNSQAVAKCKCGALADTSFLSGSHWHCGCKACGVAWCIHKRHDVVVHILVDCAIELGLTHETEVLGLYADSQGRPADILLPPADDTGRNVDRAVDVAITDCQTDKALEVYADVVSLAAATAKETKKRSAHRAMMAQHGVGLLQFDKVPFVCETSGAFGKEALKLWAWLKAKARELRLENYVMAEKQHTWSAFTFQQMYPQRISFAIAKLTARAVIQGLVRSQRLSVFDRCGVRGA